VTFINPASTNYYALTKKSSQRFHKACKVAHFWHLCQLLIKCKTNFSKPFL